MSSASPQKRDRREIHEGPVVSRSSGPERGMQMDLERIVMEDRIKFLERLRKGKELKRVVVKEGTVMKDIVVVVEEETQQKEREQEDRGVRLATPVQVMSLIASTPKTKLKPLAGKGGYMLEEYAIEREVHSHLRSSKSTPFTKFESISLSYSLLTKVTEVETVTSTLCVRHNCRWKIKGMVSVFFANSAIMCLLMVLVSLLSVVLVINSNHSVHVLDPKRQKCNGVTIHSKCLLWL